jgi:hypothetical protein
MTLWEDKTFATIGPRLAPISNVKEYKEIADTYKVDSKVITISLFVSNINKYVIDNPSATAE